MASSCRYHNATLPRCMQFRKTDPMRRDSMSWNSIYMTPKGYPAPPAFAKAANKPDGDAQPADVKEAEDMQFAEALEQVRPTAILLARRGQP